MSKSKKQTKANQSGSSFFWIVLIVAVCLLALIIVLSKISSPSEKDTNATFDYSNQPFEGDKDAPVKIVEFGDYKCPICKQFNESVYPVIQKDFVDTGKVQFYFMNFPFINTDSTRSAEFAETVYKELGNDVFWKFHHLLYNKQPDDQKYERMDYFTTDFLKKTLAEVSSDKDVKKVEAAFKNKDYKEALDKDKSYVNKLGIDATPALFIDGKKFEGSSFNEFIDEIKKAVDKK